MATQSTSAKTSIFYVNSMGFMCQWVGTVINKTEDSISIRFSKNKAFRYNLKESQFLLVTKTRVKSLGVSVDTAPTSISFDESVIETVITQTAGNVDIHWNGSKWAA